MNCDVKALIEQGDNLFGKRGQLLSLWQEVAENFYPERADFTTTRNVGQDFADNLVTSVPLLIRRDLGNSLGTMMRPTSIQWFHTTTDSEDQLEQGDKQWLEWANGVQKRAMYDRRSMFTRASKESDHDLASFGQSVKTVELNRNADGLLFRCWHLRDCAWAEDASGKVNTVHRKWKPCAIDLINMFGERCHKKVGDMMVGPARNPYGTVNCRHIVLPAENFDGEYLGKGRPGIKFVSIYIDVDNQHVMEIVGQRWFMYIVPRWQTVSGSPYAYSPATVCALPDARLLQAMTLTLLEAGEKAANPPMVSVQGALRSDLAIYAGGVTFVAEEYDERTGDAIRPLYNDKNGIPYGMEMRADLRATLQEAFFLDKLTLPERGPEMTAYEVGQRVQDYIRQASPLFEPLEDEDNGAVCETVFEVMLAAGAFGSVEDIPENLRGADIKFKFESPLHDAIDRQKVTKFTDASQLIAAAVALDPTAPAQVDIKTAFRDAMSVVVPAKWMRSEQDADAIIEAQQEAQQTQELLATIQQGGEAAKAVGEGSAALGPEALAA